MKNIHLIPTDKPSRLWANNLRRRLELDEFPSQHPSNIAKHIYITSDEIAGFENNIWVHNNGRVWLWENTMALRSNNKPKKIILTTDQDLIKDGVQNISYAFLEWFVKNPSCEEIETKLVEFEFDMGLGNSRIKHGSYYKIIIPQEDKTNQELERGIIITHVGEPKQENELCHYSGLSSPLVYAEEYKQEYEKCTGNNGNGCFMDSPGHNCGCFTRVPKEEAKYPIGGYAPGYYGCTCVTCKTEFMGDKKAVQCEPCAIKMTQEELKQEIMYSEKDMQEYAEFCIRCYEKRLPCIVAKEWFEQFKNK